MNEVTSILLLFCYFRSRADAFGVTSFVGMQNPTYEETCNGLSLNHGLVANVNNGGHWVLLTGES